MEIVTVDECSESEYVPFDQHQKLKEKYEKLQIEHENLRKSFELLEKTFGFTLDLVKRKNAVEEIKELESNIGEMQKRMLRKHENELKNNTKKRSEKREKKKKEGSLCEEKMLDVAEKTTNEEDQVQLLTQENSQEDAANMTKKRKRKRDSNTLKECNGEESTLMSKEESLVAVVTVEQGESGDVILSENVAKAQIPETKKSKKKKTKATKICDPLESVQDVELTKNEKEDKTGELVHTVMGGENVETTQSEMKESNAEELPLMSKEDSFVAVVTFEQGESRDVKLNQNVAEAQIPETKKRKKKKKKTKATKSCDPLESVQDVELTQKEKEEKMGELVHSVIGGENVETTQSEMTESNAEELPLSKEESLAVVVTVEQGESGDVKLSENVAEAQIPETKKRKKKKTKETKICDPLESVQDVELTKKEKEEKTGELVHTVMGGENVETTQSEMTESNAEELPLSKEESLAAVVTVEQGESGDVKLSENVAEAQIPETKKRKKKKTKETKICDPLESVQDVELTKKAKEEKTGELVHTVMGGENVETTQSEMKESNAEELPLMSKEDSFVAVVTFEQGESTDVKLNQNVAEAQIPETKKRKKKKTKATKICDPLESVQDVKTTKEEKEDKIGELEHSVWGGEDVETKESNAEELPLMSKEDSLVAGVTVEQGESRDVKLNENVAEAQIPITEKRKTKKTNATTICDPLESVQDVEITKNEKEDKTGELEHSVWGGEDVETKESNAEELPLMSKEDSLVAGVTVEQGESRDVKLNENVAEAQIPITEKRKTKKTKATTICDLLESVQDVEITKNEKENKTGELEHSVWGGEDVETKESNAEELPLMSKEDSLVAGVTVEQGESRDVKLNENVAEAQIPITEKRKTKKTKATTICDPLESVQDVEITKNEKEDKTGELEHRVWGGEEVKTKESEMKEIPLDHVEKDDVVQVVVMSEIGDVPRRCSCEGAKKLIILDMNGILADVAQGFTGQFIPDGKVSFRSIFKRPFVSSFLDFCFDKFDVAIWSSRRVGLNYMINTVMGDHGRNLVSCFDQDKCITTNHKTLEKKDKPLFLKDLRQVWDSFGRCNSCGNRRYDETNTLLVDDSPDKALSNPPHTAIFPYPYKYTDLEDSALGPEGELRKYLERLADAKNVQEFVEENPFGQPAITETHPSWDFYSMVVEEYK